MKPAGVILAGGMSKRFGRPKCLVKIGGIPIITILANEAKLAGIGDIIISANNHELFAGFNMRVFGDIHKDCGPLAGIHSVFNNIEADEIFIFACDTPGITAVEIRTILESADANPDAEVVFATSPSGNHPLCGLVRRTLLPSIESAIGSGRLGVNRLFTGSKHVAVRFDDETPFANLNTPEDLKKWGVS